MAADAWLKVGYLVYCTFSICLVAYRYRLTVGPVTGSQRDRKAVEDIVVARCAVAVRDYNGR